MANPYTDPTSIDYILQRAQDELRRGENRHFRASEVQYTNHVKELLSNLERYLETCGVQLPAEVITGSEATAGAAAALNESNTHQETARSLCNSQVKAGFLNNKRYYPNMYNCSVSASAVVDNVCGYRDTLLGCGAAGNGPVMGALGHSHVGWDTLATPTEAQQPNRPPDEKGTDGEDDDATAVIERVKSDPAEMDFMTNLGAENGSRQNQNGSVMGNTYSSQQQQQQCGPLKMVSSLAAHSPPGGAANETVAPLDNTSVCKGQSFHVVSGDTPLITTVGSLTPDGRNGLENMRTNPQLLQRQQHQCTTPYTESLSHCTTPHPPSNAAAAHARSLSLNAVAAGSAAHLGSGTDMWGDFGQFVQSITESRVNSNLALFQSAAATAYSIPPTNRTSGSCSPMHAAPVAMTAACNHDSTKTTPSPAVVPETSFQFPQVLTIATSPIPASLNHPRQRVQQQRIAHCGVPSPRSVDHGDLPSIGGPEGGSTQDAPAQLFYRQPTNPIDVTSVGSRSPPLPLQAAYGAGSKAVRALAAATTETDEEKDTPQPKDSPRPFLVRVSPPVDHIPSPPHQRRPGHPQLHSSPTRMVTAVPVQRAASQPVADYLPYGKGGSPYYPHILRVSTSVTSPFPQTQLDFPLQPISSKSPPPPQPHPQQQQPYSIEQGTGGGALFPSPHTEDAMAAVHSQKERLMRRLRGILGKPSLCATSNVATSLSETADHSPSVKGGGGGLWGPRTTPALKDDAGVYGFVRTIAADALRMQTHLRTAGATYPPVYTCHNLSLSPPITPHSLHAQNCPLLMKGPDLAQSFSNAPGTRVSTTEESPRMQHVSSPTKASMQLLTPSSRDMASIPTGLYSVGGLNSYTRLSSPSLLHHPEPVMTSNSSDVTSGHDGTSSRVVEVGSSTTTYSTTAPTYKASTVEPPYSSPKTADPVSVGYEVAQIGGAGFVSPFTERGSQNSKSLSGLRHNTNQNNVGISCRYSDSNEEYRVSGERNSDESPPKSYSEKRHDEKQQLMQRLRMMLSRPDE